MKDKKINKDTLNSEKARGLEEMLEGDGGNTFPLFRRLWNSYTVRHTRKSISNFTAMLVLSLLGFLMLVVYFEFDLENALEKLRGDAEEALSFLFPEYYVSIGGVSFDLDPAKPGWAVVNDISLIDAVEERTITISEISMDPYLVSLVRGNAQFHHLGVEDVNIDFKLEPPKEDSEFAIPISVLDIPANIVKTYGDLLIEDMTVRLVSSDGNEVFSITDLKAELLKNADGYDAQISARQADREEGSFVFNFERIGDDIIWRGRATQYKIAPTSDLLLNFQMMLGFENVPEYDLTESQDNAEKPYQYLETGNGLLRLRGGDISADAAFEYDNEKDVLYFENMRLALGKQKFRGNMDVRLGDAIYAHGYDFGASYPGVSGPVDFDGGSFAARINLADQILELGEVSFANQFFHIYGDGKGVLQPSPRFALNIKADDIGYDDLLNLWPADLAQKQLDLIKSSLAFGDVRDLSVWARFYDEFKVEAQMEATDLRIAPSPTVPAVQSEIARIHVTQSDFQLNAPHADLDGFESGLDFENIQMAIDDFKESPLQAELNFQASGEMQALYESMENDSFSLSKATKIPTQNISGQFSGDFGLAFPVQSTLKFEDINIMSNGEVKNIRIANMVNGEDIYVPEATIRINDNQFVSDGDVVFAGVTFHGVMTQSLQGGTGPQIDADFNITKPFLAQFGVDLPSSVKLGSLPVSVTAQSYSGGRVDFEAKVNAAELGLSAPAVGAVKAYGAPGRVDVTGRLNGANVDNANFSADLGKLDLAGSYSTARGFAIPDARLQGYYDGEIYLKGRELTLQNAMADLRNIKVSDSNTSNRSGAPWTIYSKNTSVLLQGDVRVTNINGFVRTGQNLTGEFTGLVGGQTAAKGKIWKEGAETHLQFLSNDAGGVLRSANLFKGMYGGGMNIRLKTTKYPGTYAGKVDIDDFEIRGDNTAMRLIQLASVFGVLEGDRLNFINLNADFLYMPDRFNLYSGYAYGPALGVTLGGSYNTQDKYADFFGVLTPAFLVNGAIQQIPIFGNLLGGNVGEGMFGITYRVQGPASDPNLQVNPLSLLTPGSLRNIWGNVPQAAELPPELRIE